MRNPAAYRKGDRVRDIHTGEAYTVKLGAYRQVYAGGETSDYTVELESIDASQPTPWNKSRNLEPIKAISLGVSPFMTSAETRQWENDIDAYEAGLCKQPKG